MPHAQIDTSIFNALAIVLASYPKDVVALARIERDARGIWNKNRLMGHVLLGACAAARGDSEAAKQHHDASLRLAPTRMEVWANYLVSLTILGESARVREVAFEMRDRFPTDQRALGAAMNALTELGLLQSAVRFAATGKAGQVDRELIQSESRSINSALEARELTEDDLSAAVVCARRFLADQGLLRAKFSCRYIEDDVGGPGGLAYCFYVKAEAQTTRTLERALFAHLGEARMPAETSGAVTFFFGVCADDSTEAADASAPR